MGSRLTYSGEVNTQRSLLQDSQPSATPALSPAGLAGLFQLGAESGALLQIFDAIPSGVMLADAKGNLRYWNLEARRLHGMAGEQAGENSLGELRDCLVFSQRGQTLEFSDWPLARLAAGQPVQNLELEMRRVETGESRVVRFDGFASSLGLGGDGLLLLTLQDLTERRRAEARLSESEQLPGMDNTLHKDVQSSLLAERNRFEDIVASVPGAIYSFCLRPDGSMDFPYASPVMERLFPVKVEDLRQSADSAFQAIPAADREELFASIRHSAETLEPWRGTISVDHPQKGEIWLEGSSIPRRLEDGSTLWHGVLSDVSERRALEQQLFQAQKLEAVGRLAGGVAHDFNNLLTVINGYSDMALDEVEPGGSIHSSLVEIREAGERSARLTRQLLAFSRRAVVEPEVFDVNAQLRELQKMLKRLIGEDIHLCLNPCAGTLPVLLDTGQFEQLVLNLAVNARDAMPKGGTLSLETHRVHGELLLVVRDTGCGMTREVLSRIYEPFFTTKAKGKGTGLGLAVVHGVVTGGNGRLEVESSPQKGTTFRIYFPLTESRGACSMLPSRKSYRGTETILLAEDDEEVRRVLVRGLEAQGYNVLLARDGQEAVRVASEHSGKIHLLLTDVVMPDLCGPDAAQRILAERPDLKVVFMTGYTEDERIPPEILQKPFTPYMAAARIRAVLDTPSG